MGVFIINPYVGFEDYQSENNVPKTAGPKKILVVVGGISGMQFSIIAAKRGNQVMIPSMNFTQCLRISWQYVPARGKWDWIFMNSCWKNKTNGTIGGDVDASIVTTQMMLEVAELGLATTWVGAFNHQKARELFGIPDYLVPVALLPIGYAADGVEPHPWHFKRFDMDHTVFYNSFDGITEGEAH